MLTKIEKGWQVLQDHFDVGEQYEIFRDQYDPTVVSAGYPHGAAFQMDEWQDLPALVHLQTALSDDPQLGKELRLYNVAPWWYRVHFDVSEEKAAGKNRICFGGVDYYCKVYLNGEYLGSHDGYQTAFSFAAPVKPGRNVLYVKVWSPLEFDRVGAPEEPRFLMTVRNMMKGTYEHGDSLLHRDRNPVGIWRPVWLESWTNVRVDGRMRVSAKADGNVNVKVRIESDAACEKTAVFCVVDKQSGQVAAKIEKSISLEAGVQEICLDCRVENLRLWNTWDRGGAYLYEARLKMDEIDERETIGFREVRLERTAEKTEYYLNGKRLYIRGVSYFPEPYLSLMHEGRILRDLELMKRSGCNMVRVHVHQEIPEFYALCDRMGIAVMQDTDFNWVHPKTEEWMHKAMDIFRVQLEDLYNHPSIVTWVIMNEPVEPGEYEMGRYAEHNYYMFTCPGPQMLALQKEMDPDRPAIRGSYCENDLESGDSHNYKGSIDGQVDYTVRRGLPREKFNTEFGFDGPPAMRSLINYKKIVNRLGKSEEELESISYYQYRFLKYSIESYRMCKYAPTAGHIQFMLVDCSPMAYYGIIDYWGCTKAGYQAFLESNQPIGAFIRTDGEDAGHIYVVNDLLNEYRNAKLVWTIESEDGAIIESGEKRLDVAADGIANIGKLGFAPEAGRKYIASLCLTDAEGNVLACNRYDDLFNHPKHPEGHPYHFSHTYGIRLF